MNKPLNIDNRYLRERRIPQSKSTIIKNKYATRYLSGQERMCRLSGMAQRITPQLLNLRSRDQDMHQVLKVALQPWPTLVEMKSLIEFGINNKTLETYFRADQFCKHRHEDLNYRREIRRQAVERADGTNDGPLVPILEYDPRFFARPRPRTIAIWKIPVQLDIWFIQFFVKGIFEHIASRGKWCDIAKPLLGCGKRRRLLRDRLMVTTHTSVKHMASTDAEFISEGMRHSCLSVYSMPALFFGQRLFISRQPPVRLSRSKPHFKVA